MVDFAGWLMPVQYSSIVTEHQATRRQAGLFDISHMGRIRFDGPVAGQFLDSVLTRTTQGMKLGRIRYSLVTKESGGILDDVLVYSLKDAASQDYFLVVVNAGNREKMAQWFHSLGKGVGQLQITDVTQPWAMIALQGPAALSMAQKLCSQVVLEEFKYYTGTETKISGHAGIVSRTGYTGEDGVELILGRNAVTEVADKLLELGAVPCGLGCRDTLRLEAAMPLYGHELSESIDPYTAGLSFAVDLKERNFPGHSALVELSRRGDLARRVGLSMVGKRVPREQCVVLRDGVPVGQVTSGTFSPTLERPIAMAYVSPENSAEGTRLSVDIRGKPEEATVVKLPFYSRK